MKVVPDRVLDAPPPQLEALPDFMLHEPLPQPHGASACSGLHLLTDAAMLTPARPENGAAVSEAGLTGQHKVATASGARGTKMAVGKLSPTMQQGAGIATTASGSVEGVADPAEVKRMCLKIDAGRATAAAQQSGSAGETLQADAAAEPLPQAYGPLMSAEQCLDTAPERTEGQPAHVQQRRQLVSA